MAGRVEESVWAERQDWIRRQEESGLSVAQFCRENCLHVGNFHSWRLRFAKLNGQVHIGAPKETGERQLQAFVQLPVASVAASASNGPAWIEVSLADGMVVRIPSANLAALETVLVSLGRRHQESRHA